MGFRCPRRASPVRVIENNTEIWKDISGWEGFYQVSTEGRVRSLDRITRGKHGPTIYRGKILKLARRTVKYPVVVFTREDTRVYFAVHRIIASTFLGPCPEGLEVCHNNNNRYDSRLSNLRYDTRKANMADKKK